MSSIDYSRARNLLESTFTDADAALIAKSVPGVNKRIAASCDLLFSSKTQAYREILLGCTIARIQDKSINIRQPYVEQGPNAFNGRTLDERVINPFLHNKRIPSSKRGYLSVFRRSVQFNQSIRKGLRDKSGYDAFLALLSYLESVSDDTELQKFLGYLLYRFAELREQATIALSRVQQISLEQYDKLLSGLLATPSGGRFPVLMVVATLKAIKEAFGLNWNITYQGINVADKASGAGGDITIQSTGQTIMIAEVTERPVDKSRVVATFNAKIAPAGIEDYIFFVKPPGPTTEVRTQAHQYFSQGHEVNFLEVKNWILMVLATVGKKGRAIFSREMVKLLEAQDIPRTMKVSWNQQIEKIAERGDTKNSK